MKRYLSFLLIVITSFRLIAQQEVPVTFTSPYQNNGWQLQGTLTIPVGQGPFPVAILIHGSGPADRNQTIVPTQADSCAFPGLAGDTIQIFKELAHELAQVGVASLRYDKLSLTYGAQIDPFEISPYDFVNDASAAIDFVKTHPQVDSNCVMLMGHSQGANFLPILAQRHTGISALVSMAGVAQPIDTILIRQIFYVYDSCQGNPSQAISVANSNRNAFNAVRNGTWPSGTLLVGSGVRFWADWINMTDSAIINYQAVTTPTLFIQGDLDIQVPADNAQMYENSLTRDSVEVVILPGLSHNFTFGSNPVLSPLMYDALFIWLGQQTCPQPTGLEKYQHNKITVRYLPSNRNLVVNTHNTQPLALQILGIDGRLWQQQKLQGATHYQAELLYGIPTGVYVIVLEQEGDMTVHRIAVP